MSKENLRVFLVPIDVIGEWAPGGSTGVADASGSAGRIRRLGITSRTTTTVEVTYFLGTQFVDWTTP
jgi:hypothetical protein